MATASASRRLARRSAVLRNVRFRSLATVVMWPIAVVYAGAATILSLYAAVAALVDGPRYWIWVAPALALAAVAPTVAVVVDRRTRAQGRSWSRFYALVSGALAG